MKKKAKQLDLFCPYCRARAKLVKQSEVYGSKAFNPDEYMYVCSNFNNGCDAYVLTHKGTTKPLGILANSEVRNLRIKAHRAIDSVIESGVMDKGQIYKYLETYFGQKPFHLGSSGIYNCQETIKLMKNILNTNSKA